MNVLRKGLLLQDWVFRLGLPPFVPRHSLGLKTITSPGSTLKWSKFQFWPNVGKLYGTLVAKNDLTHESESISFRGRSKTS